MNTAGYIIYTILVLLVVRQIRGTRLNLINFLLPVVLVAAAAAYYLRSIPAGGNDIAFDLMLAAAGGALGVLCALTTHLRRGSDGAGLAQAGWIAAIVWIVSIGARMGFAFWSDHGGGPAIVRFSVVHSITGANAWVAALVIMGLATVIARLVVLGMRARRLPAAVAITPDPAPAQG